MKRAIQFEDGGKAMWEKKADKILLNGRLITMEDSTLAQAIAIKGNRILYVGSNAEAMNFADGDTQVIDLKGRVAAPGLIECHTHPAGSGANMFLVLDMSRVCSLEEMLAKIREKAKDTPKGQWILCHGYDESKFRESGAAVTAAVLDSATAEHPVYAQRTCAHIAVVNSMAARLSGFSDESEDPPSGGHFYKDENGHFNGMISESIKSKMVAKPDFTAEEIKRGILEGVQPLYFRNGITATANMGTRIHAAHILKEANAEGKLKLKIGIYLNGKRTDETPTSLERIENAKAVPGQSDKSLHFLGAKFFTDGSTGGRTAAFSLPYADDPNNYGQIYIDQEHLNQDVLRCALAGVQVSIHAIGDRAIEAALQSMEYAQSQGADVKSLRFRIEHLESPTLDQIRRMKELNICAGLSSAFIYGLGDSHLDALGYDRLVDAFPAKTLMENGIPVGCNCDFPVCEVNPMLGIYSMVVRKTEKGQSFGGKKEAVDRMLALKAYTKNAAYLLWKEEELGSLKAGKIADIVVFEDDFLAVPDEALKDVRVYMTVANGETVYKMKQE